MRQILLRPPPLQFKPPQSLLLALLKFRLRKLLPRLLLPTPLLHRLRLTPWPLRNLPQRALLHNKLLRKPLHKPLLLLQTLRLSNPHMT